MHAILSDRWLTQMDTRYLSSQMRRVSRSFAVMTPRLDPGLEVAINVAYLVCRVADSIEDAALEPGDRTERFQEFLQILEQPAAATTVLSRWESLSWPGLRPYDLELMGSAAGGPLWRHVATLPEALRSPIQQWASKMALGMGRLDDSDHLPALTERDGVQLTASEHDYNRYCFYVAGTVGHMLTDLAASYYAFEPEVVAELRVHSEASGRALQKTNILKDFAEDRQRNVCFLPETWLAETDFQPLHLAGAPKPWIGRVFQDAFQELASFMTYIKSLPERAVRFREGMLICVLPAYETLLTGLRRATRLFTPEHMMKMPRFKFLRCLPEASRLAKDSDSVTRAQQRYESLMRSALE